MNIEKMTNMNDNNLVKIREKVIRGRRKGMNISTELFPKTFSYLY